MDDLYMGVFSVVGFLALWLWETDSVLERRYTWPLVFLGGVTSAVCFLKHRCVLILTHTQIVHIPECIAIDKAHTADKSVLYEDHENENDECVDMSYIQNCVTVNFHCGYIRMAAKKLMNALVGKNNRAIKWLDPFSSSGITTKYIHGVFCSDIRPEPNDQDIVVHEKDALSFNFSETKFTGLILVFPPEKSNVAYLVLKRAIQPSGNIEYIVIVQEDLKGGDSCGNKQYWDLLATLPIQRMKDVNGRFIKSAKKKDGTGFRSRYYMLHLNTVHGMA